MNGQWRSAYTGTNSGTLVINLDDAGDHYVGELFAIDNDPKLPAVNGHLAWISTDRNWPNAGAGRSVLDEAERLAVPPWDGNRFVEDS